MALADLPQTHSRKHTHLKHTSLDSELALAPQHGRAYEIHSEDGLALRIGVWSDNSTEKGTIFLLPGRADFIEKLGHALCDVHSSGFSVCVLEFRGLGLSDRLTADKRAGHVHRFSDYQRDVRAAISAASELGLPEPFFLHGNSMGGCVGLRSAIEGIPFRACAFTSPMWGVQLPRILNLIAPPITGAVRALGLGHHYAPGRNGDNETLNWTFEKNEITGDADMFAHLQHVNREVDDQWIGGPTIGWLQQALQETRHLSRQPAPNLPCITFSAERDQLVDRTAIEQRMKSWPDSIYNVVPAAKHDLLRAGPDVRSSVVKKICTFFDSFTHCME